jgi:hypothetical protein
MYQDREPRFPYDPSFLGKDSWKRFLEKILGKDSWKRFLEKILGKDSWENYEDGIFTQPGVPRTSWKDLIQIIFV